MSATLTAGTFLDAQEIAILTGRKLKSLQIDALRRMGIPFFVNATGHAVVARTAIEGGRGSSAPPTPPKQAWMPKVLKGK